MIPEHAHQRLFQPDFTEGGFAGSQTVAVEEIEPGRSLAGLMMEVHFRAVAQGAGRGGKAGQLHQPAVGREKGSRQGQHVAALHVGNLQPLHVDGGTVPGFRDFYRFTVALQAARTGGEFFGQQFQRVSNLDGTRESWSR